MARKGQCSICDYQHVPIVKTIHREDRWGRPQTSICDKCAKKMGEAAPLRYLTIVAEGGLIQAVEPYLTLKEAQKAAERAAPNLDPESDDVIVWDLHDDRKVYQPLS